MLLTKNNEVYSFSAYNLGRFDNVSALSATAISGYTSYLKTVLSDSGLKNVPLKDAVLFEYGGQYYAMHGLDGESVTVNRMQKHVDPTFFYVRIEAAESK